MLRQATIHLAVPARTALLTVEAARGLLGVDEDSVLSLIEHGGLRWAWDISLAAGRIREVRIWAESLAAQQTGSPQPGPTLEEVLPRVIGVQDRLHLRASYVRERLCCSQQHIQRLVALGALRGEVARATRMVETRSLYEFLTARLITS